MLRIVQIGLGPLGRKLVTYLRERPGLELVAAADADPQLAGRDAGVVCGGAGLGVPVADSIAVAVAGTTANAAILATVSDIARAEPQIAALAQAGLNIVTTCEELSYPWNTSPDSARRINQVCHAHGVACISTGVNPGFLMDYLPAVLTSVCQAVESVHVSRVQDAAARRVPFQRKIGAGLTREEFERATARGSLRHVGLPESVYFIAASLGWELERVTESLEPVLAERAITSGYRPITSGQPAGVEQIARGYRAGREVINLRFRAVVGEPEPADTIEIDGTPSFTSTIPGGINGDTATCAIVVNALRVIGKLSPGLKTMLDLPVPGYFQHL